MSVRSHNHRATRLAPTDPKWYPVTRGLNRWLNKMARRNDLAVRVLRGNFGAPARYVPNVAEIDFAESLLAKVDPTTVGAQDFVIKHPKIAGGAVHEAAHARWSTFDLPSIAKQYGPRHANTFALLEEGRCETQQWPDLTDTERDALSFMVLNLVLREILDAQDAEADDDAPDYDPMSDPRTLVRLVGLIAGRCETGIIDKSQVKVVALLDRLRDVLGEHFDTLWDLAVTFARSRNDDHYSDNVHTRVRHEVVRQWLATVDDLLPPDETGGSGSGKDESEEGESESGGGGGSSESDDKGDESESGGSGDDESSDDGDEDGDGADGNADGDDESDDDGEPGDTTPGDDDEGVEGDGENVIDGDDDGDASLGDYGGSSVRKTIEDVFGDLAEAAEVAEKISGSRLRSRAGDIRTAVAADHRRRRELNKEAMRRW